MTDASTSQMHCQEALTEFLKDWTTKQVTANEHAQYQLASTLAGIQEHGLGTLGAPYSVTIQALSPQGYPLTFTLANRNQGALMAEAGALFTTLQEFGCPAPGQVSS